MYKTGAILGLLIIFQIYIFMVRKMKPNSVILHPTAPSAGSSGGASSGPSGSVSSGSFGGASSVPPSVGGGVSADFSRLARQPTNNYLVGETPANSVLTKIPAPYTVHGMIRSTYAELTEYSKDWFKCPNGWCQVLGIYLPEEYT